MTTDRRVEVAGGEFFWLSAPRPIVPPGTPFPPGSTDLQAWMRNTALDPDWSRVGTDIVGGTSPVDVKEARLAGGLKLGRHVFRQPRIAVHPLPPDIPSL